MSLYAMITAKICGMAYTVTADEYNHNKHYWIYVHKTISLLEILYSMIQTNHLKL